MTESEKTDRFRRLYERIKSIRHIEWIVAALAAALILLVAFGGKAEKKIETPADVGISDEEKLESILSLIKGAGRVKVFILYENSDRQIPACDVQSQKSKESETLADGTVRVRENESVSQKIVLTKNEPLILETEKAKIGGVVVVAQGADNMTVRLNLISATKTALNIDAGKIEIYDMK